MNKIPAEWFFDPAHYDEVWPFKFFCPFDINHYLFEAVKDDDGNIHVDEYKILDGELNMEKVCSISKENFLAGYKDFMFYNALYLIPRWCV
jgi:hypothetical protein